MTKYPTHAGSLSQHRASMSEPTEACNGGHTLPTTSLGPHPNPPAHMITEEQYAGMLMTTKSLQKENAALKAANNMLRHEVTTLKCRAKYLIVALRQIADKPWGYDGDCGVTQIALNADEEFITMFPDCAPTNDEMKREEGNPVNPCLICERVAADKLERLEALELERKVNRNLYGLLEKNVASSMSKMKQERDEMLLGIIEAKNRIHEGDAEGAIKDMKRILDSTRCKECGGSGQRKGENTLEWETFMETCDECGGAGFFPQNVASGSTAEWEARL